ncbi:FkbM family methyltransferase [Seonamhaeicola sp.]|uniref:FkbM family methyltransferase n=1 Tax=Seonamhaeicola sp. TaxID=1912245 RepID=UPI002620BCAC|nr:FkbM family methyltransferase [Seonamhaeicola sp.]
MNNSIISKVFYRISKVKLIPKWIRSLGVIQLVKLHANFKTNNGENIRLKVKGYDNPIYLRPNTTDLRIFRQLFIEEEYNVDIPFKVKTIVDAGANCGYSLVYFANKFKGAKIIAIEPESSNIEMIKMNISNYRNIEVIQGGLWDKSCSLMIVNKNAGKWAFKVSETTEDKAEFMGISLEDIMSTYKLESIDLLKMDIEGSEKAVFLNHYENWLPKTRFGLLEIHESYEKGITSLVYDRLNKYNFEISQSGENLVFKNIKV